MRGDDREAFEEFVAGRRTALLRTALLLTGNHHDAEDLVQTALVQAASRWGRIRQSPEAYVRRTMANANISRWRRSRGREVLVSEQADRPQEGDDADAALVVRQALMRLTARQRSVLVLRYYDDWSERDIAAALGISPGTVKSTAREALVRLQAQLPDAATLVP